MSSHRNHKVICRVATFVAGRILNDVESCNTRYICALFIKALSRIIHLFLSFFLLYVRRETQTLFPAQAGGEPSRVCPGTVIYLSFEFRVLAFSR